MRKLTYYIASTVDGFIAGPEGEIDHYVVTEDLIAHFAAHYPETLPTHVREALGIEAAGTRFDTVVMGRATYDPALKEDITSPYAHLRQYVVSRTITESPDPDVEIVSGDPLTKVRELKAEDGGLDIYLAGGGRLAGELVSEIDELVVKVYPVFSGSGVPMFSGGFRPTHLKLTGTDVLENGTVFLTYTRK